MSRKEFMEELRRLLEELPQEERDAAVQYYESYFEEAGADQEQIVLDELGSAGRIAEEILKDYRAEGKDYQSEKKDYQLEKKEGQGVYVTNKGLSGGTLVVAILIAILTFPVWITVLATAFGLLMGLFGTCIGIVVGFGIGGAGCILGGAVALAVGIVKTFTIPIVGAALIAAGLIIFGLGCLMIAAVGGVIRLIFWMGNVSLKFLSRLFHGRREASV